MGAGLVGVPAIGAGATRAGTHDQKKQENSEEFMLTKSLTLRTALTFAGIAVLATGLGASAPRALAQTTTSAADPALIAKINQTYHTHFTNGAASTMMMDDGMMMMKISMPTKEFQAMSAMTGKNCMIEEIYPDAHNTMILVCR
jgi:hypothetical protein